MDPIYNENTEALFEKFHHPPFEYHARPLWFWNSEEKKLSNITKEGIRDIMTRSKTQSGYCGFGILPEWLHGYLSEEYMDLYRCALETAKKLGMKMCLYDENGFPSGSAGGLLAEKHPNDTMKRLDKYEMDFTQSCRAEIQIRVDAGSKYMGAVLMNLNTNEITDISGKVTMENEIYKADLNIVGGTWRLFVFFVVRDGYDRVDYLDKAAVTHLLEVTHEIYYMHFKEYFGTVIDSAFYDEPMLYQACGRTWTGSFNDAFENQYGFNPITLYPALWYDIGTQTASARNLLYGFRTQLFSENYIKIMNDWCHHHGIVLTGHMDQEENINPVTTCGDLMKIFEHQDIPGIDEISFYNRAVKAYKIVSSSAYNWDKPLVMTEVYGAMGENMGIKVLYKDIMNQFTRGVNYVVPHAVWYDAQKGVTFPPELSYRSARYASELPRYNDFIARVRLLLEGGRHIADIAMLYPIDYLESETRFDNADPYYGAAPDGADYMEVGHLLSTKICRDFTYLHPDILREKCYTQGGRLILPNQNNYESYRILIVPGCEVISCEVLRKIKTFYDAGGKIIFTSLLPARSTEYGLDEEVRGIVSEMVQAQYLKSYDAKELSVLIDNLLPVPDVKILNRAILSDGEFTYIHKIKSGRDFYYFANTGDHDLDVLIQLRGRLEQPALWNPHDGTQDSIEALYRAVLGEQVTELQVSIPRTNSLFITGKTTVFQCGIV